MKGSLIASMAERIILAFSRPASASTHEGDASVADPLELLETEYPDLEQLVLGMDVLDFGCGKGREAVALAKKYGAKVVGLDTNAKTLKVAIEHGQHLVRFTEMLSADQKFDIVISQNAMEHFHDPVAAVEHMKAALKPGGRILMTFGPPWYAPYGSHMYFFCRLPWMNLLFPEQAVMSVRSRYRSDGATTYEEVESGLNRMTLRKFERIIANSGLTVERLKYHCIRRMDFFGYVPLLRELTCNHVTSILRYDPD